MELIGKLKSKVDNAASKEEKRSIIEEAGMALTDDELDQVAGGRRFTSGNKNLWGDGDNQGQPES